jgi:hypothetical protein
MATGTHCTWQPWSVVATGKGKGDKPYSYNRGKIYFQEKGSGLAPLEGAVQ